MAACKLQNGDGGDRFWTISPPGSEEPHIFSSKIMQWGIRIGCLFIDHIYSNNQFLFIFIFIFGFSTI